MLRRISTLLCILFLLSALAPRGIRALAFDDRTYPSQDPDVLMRSYFTENNGQWHPSIRFTAYTEHGSIAITDQGIIQYEFEKTAIPALPDFSDFASFSSFPDLPAQSYGRMHFTPFPLGVTGKFQAEGLLPHFHHYFVGNDSSKWANNCRNYSQIRLLGGPDGNDLVLSFASGALRCHNESGLSLLSDDEATRAPYTVAWAGYVGGSIDDMIAPKNNLLLDEQQHLIMTGITASPDFMLVDPEGINESFVGLMMGFILKLSPNGDQIDYITFIGGSEITMPSGIKFTSDGHLFLFGTTTSSDFPIQDPLENMDSIPGLMSMFMTVLQPDGSEILRSSYYGGMLMDMIMAMTMGSNGKAYLSGMHMGGGFPVDSYLHEPEDKENIETMSFLLVFDPDEFVMEKSIFLSEYMCIAISLDLNSSGELAMAGMTDTDTMELIQPLPEGKVFQGYSEGFIWIWDPSMEKLSFSSYLGGSNNDLISNVLWNGPDQLMIAGSSYSLDFPGLPQIDTPAFDDEDEEEDEYLFSFVLNINWKTPQIEKSFFIYESRQTFLFEMQRQLDGSLILAGYTDDMQLPNCYPLTEANEENDLVWAFMAVLDPDLTQIQYSTIYVGEYAWDEITNLALGEDGSIYMAGFTFSSDLYVNTSLEIMQELAGESGIYLLKLIPAIEDENPPLIVLDIPDSPSYTAEPEFQLNGQITDEESSIARATINGDLLRLEPDGSFTHTLTLAEGSNLFLLEAWDSYQNKAEVSFELVYDPGKPVIELIKPNAGMVLVKSTVIVRFIVENKLSPIDRVTVSVNGELQHEIQGSQEEVSGNQQSVELQLQKELNTILITASNQAGTSTELTFTYWLGVHRKVSLQIGSNKAQITIDDEVKEMTLDAPPIIINNRTMVPVRFIAEAFGAKVSWDASEQAIMIEFEDKLLTLWIGRDYAIMVYDEAGQRVNKILQLDSPPVIVGNRTMVPVRFITEALGAYEVQYEAVTRSIYIYIITLR